jgi:hypothetical protein
MTKTLAFFSALTAFALAAQAVGDHAALIRAGYDISSLRAEREEVVTSEGKAREQVGRLSSPAVLAGRARDLGLVTGYPTEYPVVRVDPERQDEPEAVLVQNRR